MVGPFGYYPDIRLRAECNHRFERQNSHWGTGLMIGCTLFISGMGGDQLADLSWDEAFR